MRYSEAFDVLKGALSVEPRHDYDGSAKLEDGRREPRWSRVVQRSRRKVRHVAIEVPECCSEPSDRYGCRLDRCRRKWHENAFWAPGRAGRVQHVASRRFLKYR